MIDWFPSQTEISSSDGESSAADGLSETEIVDAFPSMIFDDLCEVRQILTISTSMQSLKTSKNDVVPVIPFLKDYSYDNDNTRFYQRVVFYNLIQDRTLLFDRFDRLYDRASIRLPRTGHEDIDWSALENKLTKDPRLTHRCFRSKTNKTDGLNRKGNVDNRQSFVYRNHHLVKTHLTNGVRTTSVYDLYIIFNIPILIYRQNSGYQSPEGSFYANTRRLFDAYLLDSTGSGYTIYGVVPGTTYLTISLQKTCYSIVRVTERVFSELQKQYLILDAFDSNNVFRPKSQAELDKITQINCIKRKRGRPAKSLDKMYWYRNSPPVQYLVDASPTDPAIAGAPIEVKVEPVEYDEENEASSPKKSRSDDGGEGVKNEAAEYLDNFFEQEIHLLVPQNSNSHDEEQPSMPVL